MNRPLFFAFYPADFANDINVEAMSTTAVGAYILLLCKAWQSDPPGSLPNNDQTLARLARLGAAEWAEVSAAVLACFELRTDGRWHQARLRREYDKALATMKGRKKGGVKGAGSRWRGKAGAGGKVDDSPIGSAMAEPDLSHGDLDGDGEKKDREDPPKPPAKPGGGEGADGPKTAGKGGKTTEPGPESVPIPAALDTPEFRDAWAKFVAYRAGKGKKAAMTTLAAELALKKLARVGPAVAVERIERAIMNGWLGVEYESDKRPGGGGHGGSAGPGIGVGRGGRASAPAGKYDHLDAGSGLAGAAGPARADGGGQPPDAA